MTFYSYMKTHTPICFSLIYQLQNQDRRKTDASPLPSPCKPVYTLVFWGKEKVRNTVENRQSRSVHQITERKPRKMCTHCFHTSLPHWDSAAQRTCRKYWRRTQLCRHMCLYKIKNTDLLSHLLRKIKNIDLLSHLPVQNKEHRFELLSHLPVQNKLHRFTVKSAQ